MRLEAIAPAEWDTRLATAWHALVARASEPSVVLTPGWVGEWWRAYGAARQLRLFALGGEDEPIGRAPLFVRDREAVVRVFARRGLALDDIYDPPLDLYAADLAERLPSPPAARAWQPRRPSRPSAARRPRSRAAGSHPRAT